MTTEETICEERHALAAAVNARDLDRVKSFLHPSFVSKTTGGSVLSRDDLLTLFVEPLFRSNKDWGEDIEIEDVQVNGDTAVLIVRRSHWYSPSWISSVLTLGLIGTKSGVDQSRETWQFVDDRWQIVEQQQVNTNGA